MESSTMDNVMDSSTVDNTRTFPPMGNDFETIFMDNLVLLEAVYRDDLDTIKALMLSGYKNFRDSETAASAIQLVVEHRNLEILEMLITAGALKCSKCKLKLTTLRDLCWIKDINILRGLVAQIKDLNRQDASQKTMLYCAVKENNPALVKALLERNVDVSIVINEFEETVLHYACGTTATDIEMIKVFVASGVDFDLQMADGCTAFFKALAMAKHDVVWYIMTHAKPSITAQFEYGPTALNYAAMNRHVDMIQALVDLGLDINGKACWDKRHIVPGKADSTPLGMAILFFQSQVYEYLVYRGAEYDLNQICTDDSKSKYYPVVEIDRHALKETILQLHINNDSTELLNITAILNWRYYYHKFRHNCHAELFQMRQKLISPDLSVFQLVSSIPKLFLKYYAEHPNDLIEILDNYEEQFPIYIAYFKNTVLRDAQKEFRKRRAEKIITHFLNDALNFTSHYIAQKIVKHMTPFDLIYFNDVSCMDVITLPKYIEVEK